MSDNSKELLEKVKLMKSKIEELIHLGELETASQAIDKCEELVPEDAELLSMKAIVLMVEGKWTDAKTVLMKGLDIDPYHTDLLYNQAYWYEQQQDYQSAYDIYCDLNQLLPAGQEQEIRSKMTQLKELDPNIRDKKKLVFFVKEKMDNFINDIIHQLSAEYRTKKIVVTHYPQIDDGMKWADICWFEWCDELIIYGSKLQMAQDKKIICRLHSYEAFTNYPKQVNWTSVDHVIFVAEHIKKFVLEQIKGLSEDQAVVIPNGIDINKFAFKEREKGFRIAYVGYINYKKGPMLLLQSFKAIFDRDPRYTLHIAGQFQDPRDMLYFRQMIAEFGLQKHVIYEGWQDDINQWLEDKHFIISTSVLEGNPVGVMEAMARGIKPLIHNFVGAKYQFGKFVWSTMDELIDMLMSEEYAPREYRKYIEERYSLDKQINQIHGVLQPFRHVEASQEIAATVNPGISGEVSVQEVTQFYDNFLGYLQQDRQRDNPRHLYIKQRLQQIVRPGHKVLDLGCGIGITTEFIHSLGVEKVIGVDLSPKLIEYAKSTVAHVEFIAHDITTLDLNEQYDVISLCDVMEHVPRDRYPNLFRVIRNHLKEDGIVFITIPDPEYLDFIRKIMPDKLQIIDNSIMYQEMNDLCRDNHLSIKFFNAYKIFIDNEYNEYVITTQNYKKAWDRLLSK
ncbi:methyltransferase domain-containing protein [Paenibacillus naphthalenovorans]|uniref:SAM-dependent methyltransferase n=1 Tax=Paenibacillus naphthalenovorans TaxID=162209 RepID=A0A0U2INE6_9BACL|nr:methyltransferase domain-containing protein [Paenibacillus naphthalenovorans]ALS24475.1 SAM-dependent methyltransferase [Paenibacillus naphthalenovorans]